MSLCRASSPAVETPRRASDAPTRAVKTSFSSFPEPWNTSLVTADHRVRAPCASEVPRWKRIAQVAVTVTYCLFAAGIVFGYAAIKPVLKAEGAYRHVCSSAAAGQDDNDDQLDICVELRLNLMFTVAAVATNVAALPVGAILDRFGPRVCAIAGSLLLAAGALLIAAAPQLLLLLPLARLDGLLLGYLLLALGGPFTYLSAFHLSNAFPHHSGLILSLLVGAFDASSALFAIYRLVDEGAANRGDGSDGEKALGPSRFFLVYLVVPCVIVLAQLFLLPAQSYKTVGDMKHDVDGEGGADGLIQTQTPCGRADENSALLRNEAMGNDEHACRQKQSNGRSGVWGVMHQYSAWEQICSPWFILICLFTVIQMLRINFFVATVRPQYDFLLPSPPAASAALSHFFDLALPVGGLVSVPLSGLVLDRASCPAVLTLLATAAAVIGLLGIVRGSPAAAYAHVALFVLYRPVYYTAVSDYCAKVFGFATFGTVYGAAISLAGLGLLLQPGLDYAVHETFGGDPVPVNLGLLAAGLVVGVVLTGYVGVRVRERGDGARESAVPA